MTIKVAINGYGRIGRNILRALYESNRQKEISVVAINDLGDTKINAHLTQYDTTHGRFKEEVKVGADGSLIINGDEIQVLTERSPNKLPWQQLGIDVVFECTGLFASSEKAKAHLEAGAKKVLISAPAGNDVPTIVYGVNHQILKSTDTIISNASCTTNCLVPVVKPLHDSLNIQSGLMTTVHAYTNDQVLTDVYHEDLRRARSATQSMIPTKTGAASAIGLVLPELKGKLDGFAIRVPTINVSVVDLTVTVEKRASVDEVNQILKVASETSLKGILAYNDLPLVSVDFNHNPFSATLDATQTKVIGNLIKVLAWYDNEWGFSNRMLDTAIAMMKAK
ncbi:MAG: type I glyceraldehyde-3-phosphate dehydrogenase [Proteobacteria bacterium]|nr:type I glyceraldehyde-3-phosphate dehydrogenase [Pseudomonadota bacterium]